MVVTTRSAGVLLLCALLAGCASRSRNEAPLSTGHNIDFTEARPEGFADWNDSPPVYRVGAGDKLKIKFLVTQELDESVTVTPDGFIGVRVAGGQLKAEGRTVPEIERNVRAAARGVVASQPVTVELEQAVSSRVYVGGAVARPGAYPLTNTQIGSLEAILLAGGYSDEARPGQVAVIRRSPDGKPMLRTIDIREIIQTGGAADVPLRSGDVLYVPKSSIAELNQWMKQFVEGVVPFNRNFTYTLGAYRTTSGGIIP
ncbi:polysaccharide biosynthesis/export family protein [Pseudochelatococcus lubricantis]|uniref:polysaccharide biosynthesis/export family protein n=1 Tax=Pseudochelatococcus lubricantis TaxID=1538102 RepID=UPI0035F03262